MTLSTRGAEGVSHHPRKRLKKLTIFRNMVGAKTVRVVLPGVSQQPGKETSQKSPEDVGREQESSPFVFPVWLSQMEFFVGKKTLARFLLCVCSGILHLVVNARHDYLNEPNESMKT